MPSSFLPNAKYFFPTPSSSFEPIEWTTDIKIALEASPNRGRNTPRYLVVSLSKCQVALLTYVLPLILQDHCPATL